MSYTKKINVKRCIKNTLKIALSAVIAIEIAEFLKLDSFISAGIIAILSVQPNTKQETLKAATLRILAFLSALLISFTSFKLLGFNSLGYGVYLLLDVGVCVFFGWTAAITINAVLISHFLLAGNMDMHMLINESLLFVIGVSTGFAANLHLRKDPYHMEELRDSTDSSILRYLVHISKSVANKKLREEGEELFNRLNSDIEKANFVAEENYKNQFNLDDTYDLEYINMRRNQAHILYQMDKIARSISLKTISTDRVEDFIKKLALERRNYERASELLEEFYELDASMKSIPLPVSRPEFEDRARLFAIMRLLEEFLQAKSEFASNNS